MKSPVIMKSVTRRDDPAAGTGWDRTWTDVAPQPVPAAGSGGAARNRLPSQVRQRGAHAWQATAQGYRQDQPNVTTCPDTTPTTLDIGGPDSRGWPVSPPLSAPLPRTGSWPTDRAEPHPNAASYTRKRVSLSALQEGDRRGRPGTVSER